MRTELEYKYNRWGSRVITTTILLALFTFFGILMTLGSIILLLDEPSAENFGSLLLSIYITVGVFFASSIIINMYPILRISSQGLKIRIFTYRFELKFIPWNEIKEIRSSSKYFQHHGIWIIVLGEDVSFWHRLLRKKMAESNDPAIFFSSDLSTKYKFLDEFGKYINCSAWQEE